MRPAGDPKMQHAETPFRLPASIGSSPAAAFRALTSAHLRRLKPFLAFAFRSASFSALMRTSISANNAAFCSSVYSAISHGLMRSLWRA
jgi:hypothetical protein